MDTLDIQINVIIPGMKFKFTTTKREWKSLSAAKETTRLPPGQRDDETRKRSSGRRSRVRTGTPHTHSQPCKDMREREPLNPMHINNHIKSNYNCPALEVVLVVI